MKLAMPDEMRTIVDETGTGIHSPPPNDTPYRTQLNTTVPRGPIAYVDPVRTPLEVPPRMPDIHVIGVDGGIRTNGNGTPRNTTVPPVITQASPTTPLSDAPVIRPASSGGNSFTTPANKAALSTTDSEAPDNPQWFIIAGIILALLVLAEVMRKQNG